MAGTANLAAAARINQGALAAIFEQNSPAHVEHPIVQCVQVKPIAAQPGAPERFRVVFSDIKNYVQSMLATSGNIYVTEGKLRRGVFCRLTQYQANQVKGKKWVGV